MISKDWESNLSPSNYEFSTLHLRHTIGETRYITLYTYINLETRRTRTRVQRSNRKVGKAYLLLFVPLKIQKIIKNNN